MVLKIVCVEVANRLGRLPEGIKATFEELNAGNYVVGDSAVKVQPKSTHPPLVRISAMEGWSDMEKENSMSTISEALCREFKLSAGNIYIEFHDLKAGHVFSNGRMIYSF